MLSYACRSIYLSIYLSVCLSVCICICKIYSIRFVQPGGPERGLKVGCDLFFPGFLFLVRCFLYILGTIFVTLGVILLAFGSILVSGCGLGSPWDPQDALDRKSCDFAGHFEPSTTGKSSMFFEVFLTCECFLRVFLRYAFAINFWLVLIWTPGDPKTMQNHWQALYNQDSPIIEKSSVSSLILKSFWTILWGRWCFFLFLLFFWCLFWARKMEATRTQRGSRSRGRGRGTPQRVLFQKI